MPPKSLFVSVILFSLLFVWTVIREDSIRSVRSMIRSVHQYATFFGLFNRSNDLEKDEEQLVYCDIFNTDPMNGTVCGRKFSTAWVPYLERFNLSDRQINAMTKDDDIRILRKEPVHVCPFDDSHFASAMHSLTSFTKLLPSKKIIIYDLGLNEEYIQQLRNLSYISEIRLFNYSAYPDYVRDLFGYRWKPLLLAELLQEFEAVFYTDAHITWGNGNITDLLDKIRCEMDGCGYYYGSLLLGHTIHSIFATTDYRLYEYLPMNMPSTKTIRMCEASFQVIYYTKDVRQNIHKWNVLCALEEECMAPNGTTLPCHWAGKDTFTAFAKCHRYDQSVVNILLANRNRYNVSRYCLSFPHGRW